MIRTHQVSCWLALGPRGWKPIVRRTRHGVIAAWVNYTGRIILSDEDFERFAKRLQATGWKLRKATVIVKWRE